MTIPFPADVKAALRRAATKARRSSNAQVVHYVERGLAADGVEVVAQPEGVERV